MAVDQLITLAVASFFVGFSGALVPGPVFVATVIQSTRRGYVAGPLIVSGHIILEAAIISALYLGLSFVISSSIVKITIGFLGGGFLLWMGLDLINFSKKASFKLSAEKNQAILLKYGSVLTGIVTSAMNPYFFIWWALLGNDFMLKGFEIAGLIGISVFAISHWMSDLSWYTIVSFSVDRGRKFLSDKTYKMILFVCGLFLVALSLTFIAESLMTLP
jgi:threonine/homoserine/homoserine lactone efflux protein